MSILQNLKMLNKPLDELAMLPQETIMQMAQREQIPPSYVAPILGRKAELAQAGANAAAMAQARQNPGSVMDQLIAQNAAAEAKSAEDMGVGSLPVREDMYASAGDQRYAGGGIIAFAKGDEVTDPMTDADGRDITGYVESMRRLRLADDPMTDETGADITGYRGSLRGLPAAMPAASASAAPGTPEYLKYLEETRAFQKAAGYDFDAIRKAEEARLARQESELGDQRKQDAWMAALTAGLGILGGESPYAFTNIGKGAQMGAEAYGKSTKEARAAQKEIGKARSDLAKAEQLDRKGLAEEAMKLREGALGRLSREKIAATPPDDIRIAEAIRLPGESLSDALARKTDITNTKDQYSAAAGLVKSAFDSASEQYKLDVSAGGSMYAIARAAAGDENALKKVKMSQEDAKKKLAEHQKSLLDSRYAQIGMDNVTANRYLRAPRDSKAPTGSVDKNNPLLKD